MQITISKTIQVRQFEPLTVTVTDEADCDTEQDAKELYEQVGSMVKRIIVREFKRYDELAGQGAVEDSKAKTARKSIPTLKKKQTKVIG